ncbi:hypothetical protein [Nocardia bhagyanarayanae]|uniref:Uncharacterized protein n=1 Tax=Nocardia bhagyanarayanae TaxID=1215925 RepID=A0A543FA42_9NOCA|nr:hypothetical protein [Nocardia bhagyanarayanae]TQM30698.1 hypothetical protein FB390_2333 [Nocardia bhagyanarayanae]
MSDREEPGRGSHPEPGGTRFDAVERLRRRLENLRAAETGSADAGDGTSKVTRLPRRPRRISEAGEHPQQPWRSEGGSVYDPAPTRPVLRSELQAETGRWPVDPGTARHAAPEDHSGSDGQDASVIDLGAMRRKRAGEDAPAAGIRRIARPRRIGPKADTDDAPDSGRNDDPDR